ncbi:MAG: hypothetical protein AAGF81_08455 [Pseudomonadota bacterium]
MTSKMKTPKRDRIFTPDVICAWLIAFAMLGGLALMGYGNGSLPFPA